MIIVRGPELIGKYIGSSEAAIRQVFDQARRLRPCVLCFDELDALAPRRGHDNTGVTDRIVNQLLTEIDGTGDRNGVFVIGTSSRADLIDPALLRSGRIDVHVEIGLPDTPARSQILKGLCPDLEDGLVQELASICEGFSGADLKGLLYDAQMESLRGKAAELVHLAKSRTKLPTTEGAKRIGRKTTYA